jgi:hypothetical protein
VALLGTLFRVGTHPSPRLRLFRLRPGGYAETRQAFPARHSSQERRLGDSANFAGQAGVLLLRGYQHFVAYGEVVSSGVEEWGHEI